MAEDEGRCHLPHLPHLPRRYKQHNWCVNSCGEAPLALPGSPLAFSGHKDLSFLSVANHSLIRLPFNARLYCLLLYSVSQSIPLPLVTLGFVGLERCLRVPFSPKSPTQKTQTLIVTPPSYAPSLPCKQESRINSPGSPLSA